MSILFRMLIFLAASPVGQFSPAATGVNKHRAFLETAETGSLSAAARKFGLTQPTRSRQVFAIEQRMGVTVFERVGNQVTTGRRVGGANS